MKTVSVEWTSTGSPPTVPCSDRLTVSPTEDRVPRPQHRLQPPAHHHWSWSARLEGLWETLIHSLCLSPVLSPFFCYRSGLRPEPIPVPNRPLTVPKLDLRPYPTTGPVSHLTESPMSTPVLAKGCKPYHHPCPNSRPRPTQMSLSQPPILYRGNTLNQNSSSILRSLHRVPPRTDPTPIRLPSQSLRFLNQFQVPVPP